MITGGAGDDHIFGGALGDTIDAGGNNDVVVGDGGRLDRARDPDTPDLQVFLPRATSAPVVLSFMDRLRTTEWAEGGADTISGEAGADIILGGHEGDTIYGDDSTDSNGSIDLSDIIVGDNGEVDYTVTTEDPGVLREVFTTDTTEATGGADTIFGGAGNDLILGGVNGSADEIHGGTDDDIILGDDGRLIYDDAIDPDLSTLDVVETGDVTLGDGDLIFGDAGDDVVLGGTGEDRISGNEGNDIVLGDFGVVTLLNNEISTLETTDQTDGAGDVIFGNEDDDMLVGGTGDDLIDGDEDSDLIFGDQLEAIRRADDVTNPRFQTLLGQVIYRRNDEIPTALQGAPLSLPDIGDVLTVSIDPVLDLKYDYRDPDGHVPAWADYLIVDLVHSDSTDPDTFGGDYIAGGAGHDQIFGQLGNDVIQGDGSIDSADTSDDFVGAERLSDGQIELTPGQLVDSTRLEVAASFDAESDGDDYIEGNGGSDVIFGNLGQDDIIGGSSELFTLDSRALRPDAGDILFGGSGTEIDPNELLTLEGDAEETDIAITSIDSPHARDADAIAGDNANIFRLVGVNGTDGLGVEPGQQFLTFNYDELRGDSEQIRARAVDLLDYTPGGPDFEPNKFDDQHAEYEPDIGAADEIHGESGDDFVYGMVGDDALFGDSESDDLIGGWGNDWISGGQGLDGVLGDDGRILTGRYQEFDGQGNKSEADPTLPADYAELLNGVLEVDELDKLIRTPGDIQTAIINPSENGDGVLGEIFKTADLTPFNLDPSMLQDREFDPQSADDILYGGLGNDFIHAGAGDDAVSGAEALDPYYASPVNPGDVLRYNETRIEFFDYDEEVPRAMLGNVATGYRFLLNFDPSGDPNADLPADEAVDDNFDEDQIFGDLGNDWIVGGPDNDNMFGGFGNDLLDADDDKTTNGNGTPGDNYGPDPINIDIQDRAFGGAGRDVLNANTGGDRLIDWIGEFNSFLTPFAPFGEFTVTRAVSPHIFDFLYDLSESLGADQSRAVDSGNDTDRNGEPDGELGLVTQKDSGLWQDQTGAPIDPQPGNIPGGKRLTLRGVDFNDGTTQAFAVDQGVFEVKQGRLEVSSTNLGETASAVFHVGEYLPHYFEITAKISTGKPTGGLKANSYLIFDYISPTDFKYAGVNISTDKLEMGYVDEAGWHELVQVPSQLKHSTDYDVMLAINGTTATLVVDNKDILTYAYDPRVDDDGFSYGLNYGLVGLGGISSVARIDNVIVQKLSPEITFEATETFDAGAPGFAPTVGDWQLTSGSYQGASVLPDEAAISLFGLTVEPNSYLELEVAVSPDTLGGVAFDYYSDGTYKFAGVLADTDQVVIGHVGKSGSIVYDAVADITFSLPSNDEYQLRVSLQGTTTSVAVLGGNGPNQTWYDVVGHVFNAVAVDGQAGLISASGQSTFDDFAIRTDDPAFISDGEELLAPSLSAETNVPVLEADSVQPLVDEAIRRLSESYALNNEQQAALADVDVAITDLPGLVLARHNGNLIELDHNAAGHGWFVDPTPGDDSEYDTDGQAIPGSAAAGGIDLLTAIAHEFGHELGFDHESTPLMADSLTASVRIGSGLPVDADKEATSEQRATFVFHDQLNEFLSVEETRYASTHGNEFLSVEETRYASTHGLDPLFDEWFADTYRDSPSLSKLAGAYMSSVKQQGSGESERVFAHAADVSEPTHEYAAGSEVATDARGDAENGAENVKSKGSSLINWASKSGLVARLSKLR
jgi:Ca2+-binding RTX toxin-like protein